MNNTTFSFAFRLNDKGNPPAKLADAELCFEGGVLDGMRLVGFSVWEGRNGARRVMMPARQYSMNGERRSYAMFRPCPSFDIGRAREVQDRVSAALLEAFTAFEAKAAAERGF